MHPTSPPVNGVPRRVVLIGNSGSGKTTAARRLSRALEMPHLELDSVFHQQDRTPLPTAELRRRVEGYVRAHPRFVVDGNYSAVRDILWSSADTIIWIDIPRVRNFASIFWRTARRFALRTELWNGNRETTENWTHIHDPERSILAWAWTRHGVYRTEYARLMATPPYSGLRILRATSRQEVQSWTYAWKRLRDTGGADASKA